MLDGGKLRSWLIHEASTAVLDDLEQQQQLLQSLEAAHDPETIDVMAQTVVNHLLIASDDDIFRVELIRRVLPRIPVENLMRSLVCVPFAYFLTQHQDALMPHVRQLFTQLDVEWRLMNDHLKAFSFESAKDARLFHMVFGMACCALRHFPEYNDMPVVQLVSQSAHPSGRLVLNLRDDPQNAESREQLELEKHVVDCRLQLLRGIPQCSGHYILQSLAVGLRDVCVDDAQQVDAVLRSLSVQVASWEETDVYPRALAQLVSKCAPMINADAPRWDRVVQMVIVFLSCSRLEIKTIALECLSQLLCQVAAASAMGAPLVHLLTRQTVFEESPFDFVLLRVLTDALHWVYPLPKMLSEGFFAYEKVLDNLVRDLSRPNAKLDHRNCILSHVAEMIDHIGDLCAAWINALLGECLDSVRWGNDETRRIVRGLIEAIQRKCPARMDAYAHVLEGYRTVST